MLPSLSVNVTSDNFVTAAEKLTFNSLELAAVTETILVSAITPSFNSTFSPSIVYSPLANLPLLS